MIRKLEATLKVVEEGMEVKDGIEGKIKATALKVVEDF